MAIKSTLISTVNGFITSIVTVAKVRSALLEIINNFYPTLIIETFLSTNVITQRNLVNTALEYDVKIYKQGRTVFINGFVKNTTASIVNDYFLTIVGSEYLPSPVSYAGNKYLTNNNLSTSGLSLNTVSNQLNGIVPANTTVIFSLSYPTLN